MNICKIRGKVCNNWVFFLAKNRRNQKTMIEKNEKLYFYKHIIHFYKVCVCVSIVYVRGNFYLK